MKEKSSPVIISKRTSLRIADHEEIVERLYNAIWICKIGNLSEAEALDYVNSGELGHYEQTEQEIKNNVKVPIKITRTTYYKYKSILESPEYQTKQTFKLFRDEYVSEIIQRFKLFKTLEAESLRSLKQETDPYKKQLIINGIFKNSPFTTSLMDEAYHMLKYKKMPFFNNNLTQDMQEDQNTVFT